MYKQKIIFRADGNSEIGLGHIIRSIALADILKDDFICEFATRFTNDFIQQETSNVCSNMLLLPEDDKLHFDYFLNILTGNEVVVLDNYFFTIDYQKAIKAKGCKLVCIDDLADKHFVADLVINHSPGIDEKAYSKEDYTQLALGLDYALLRKNFYQQNAVKRNYTTGFKKVLISFGGSQNINLIKKYLGFLENTTTQEIVVLVAGYDFYTKVGNLLKNYSKPIHLKKDLNANELCSLLQEVNLAIVPSSTMSFEVLACNIPLLTGYFIGNQKLIYKGLLKLEQLAGISEFSKVSEPTFLAVFKSYEKFIIGKFEGYSIIKDETPQNIRNQFNKLIA